MPKFIGLATLSKILLDFLLSCKKCNDHVLFLAVVCGGGWENWEMIFKS